ncbi:MAG: glycosyltransferase family 39 protein [Anaerolineae bacterium]|nr:glycosyltransferase family 39 protein [Anaerolineae bacterium]
MTTRVTAVRCWGVFAIFLVALAARLYGLTYHSLWFDEVMSTFWAAKPASEIWRVGLSLAQDKHPPLYYLALHGWTALFGLGDVAVRSLGALIGALAVLPVYGIGKTLGGVRAGAFAALLVALNPFLVWYSQEARMFMPATTFALVGMYGALRIFACGSRIRNSGADDSATPALPKGPKRSADVSVGNLQSAILLIVGFTAALYTYLFSAFLLPVAGAWVLLGWWLTRKEPGAGWRLGLGFGALAVVGLLFLPLARSAWLVSGGESTPGRAFDDMGVALWRMLQVYTLGWPHWPAQSMTAVAIGAVALALLGCVVNSKQPIAAGNSTRSAMSIRHSAFRILPSGGFCLALWFVLPLLLGGLLLARDRTVFAETRYFIFLVPALCLAWGRALAWLWRRQRTAGLVLSALVFGVTLAALPTDWSPQNRREAWREAAAFVQTRAGSNDAILIQADYVHPAFKRYFGGPQPIFYPFTDRLSDPTKVEGPLEGLAGYDTVWLVQSHHQELDPGNLVTGWFSARYPLATEVFPAGIAVRAFAQRYRQPAPVADQSVLMAADALRLLRCDYAPRTLSAREEVFHPPSNWVHVTTSWQADAKRVNGDLFPRARLIDAAGQVWGESLDRPNDALHVWPTSRWLPGEVVRVDYDVNLNPVTPPGTYRLVIDLPLMSEQVVCGDVRITSDE